MGNYRDLSDDAQSFLLEVSNNSDDAPVLHVSQRDQVAERAGISLHGINSIVDELFKKGIVSMKGGTGKELVFDPAEILAFRRDFANPPKP